MATTMHLTPQDSRTDNISQEIRRILNRLLCDILQSTVRSFPLVSFMLDVLCPYISFMLHVICPRLSFMLQVLCPLFVAQPQLLLKFLDRALELRIMCSQQVNRVGIVALRDA